MPYFTVLSRAKLCHVIYACYTLLYATMPYDTIPCPDLACNALDVLCCSALLFSVLYYTIYYIVYHTKLHYTTLYSSNASQVRNSGTGAVYVVENRAEQAPTESCRESKVEVTRWPAVPGRHMPVSDTPFRSTFPSSLRRWDLREGENSEFSRPAPACSGLQDWSCMKGGYGQRAQCPANAPTMCAQQTCRGPIEQVSTWAQQALLNMPRSCSALGGADKKDYCCSPSCVKLGGARQCAQAGHSVDLCLK